MLTPEQEPRFIAETLQTCTLRLMDLALTDAFHAESMRQALAAREAAVRRFQELAQSHPEAFSRDDLSLVRESVEGGSQAFEKLMQLRKEGWNTASELLRTEYVLNTFAKAAQDCDATVDA